jgi:hypothetical protein
MSVEEALRRRQAGGKLVTASIGVMKVAAMYMGKPGTPAAYEDDIQPFELGMTPEEAAIIKRKARDKSLKRSGMVY